MITFAICLGIYLAIGLEIGNQLWPEPRDLRTGYIICCMILWGPLVPFSFAWGTMVALRERRRRNKIVGYFADAYPDSMDPIVGKLPMTRGEIGYFGHSSKHGNGQCNICRALKAERDRRNNHGQK